MQQAARVSDFTGFFNIEGTGKPGKLVEMDETKTIFCNPQEGDGGLRLGPVRLRGLALPGALRTLYGCLRTTLRSSVPGRTTSKT